VEDKALITDINFPLKWLCWSDERVPSDTFSLGTVLTNNLSVFKGDGIWVYSFVFNLVSRVKTQVH
jgi:hypothetical protein